jgi:hypothetical protein
LKTGTDTAPALQVIVAALAIGVSAASIHRARFSLIGIDRNTFDLFRQ